MERGERERKDVGVEVLSRSTFVSDFHLILPVLAPADQLHKKSLLKS